MGDIDAQAARVVTLLENEEMFERMSRAARHTAETRFDSARIIPRYEEYYQEVCEAVLA